MAAILRETYKNNVSEGPPAPVLYVDSLNINSFVSEMYNITVRYIREAKNEDGINTNGDDIKKDDHIAKDYNDIYYNKLDGYWMVTDEKNRVLTLYKKTTIIGTIYNSYTVVKIYTLICGTCPRVVPRIIKDNSKWDNFVEELQCAVQSYKKKSDI